MDSYPILVMDEALSALISEPFRSDPRYRIGPSVTLLPYDIVITTAAYQTEQANESGF